MSLVGLHTLTR